MGTMTILFADQVGSTLQLSTLGDNSALEVLDQMQAVVNEHLERHDGVFHKHTGDGFMASFGSCVDAVDCALALQATTSAFNAGLPFERRVVLRMGLHTGEPLPHPSGPVGAAVVVAARLCQLAGAGQVLVSDVVRALLEPRRTFVMTPVGARRLKGFAEPMLCYLVRAQEQAASPALPPELDADRAIPFIGRAAELDRLRIGFVEAAEGTAHGLVVTGEAGAGKTRLVIEFAAEAHQQGARLLYASGVQAVDVLANELRSRHRTDTPVMVVADDVTDVGTIRDIAALLHSAPSTRVLAVVVTTLSDLDEQILGLPVVQLGGLDAHDVKYLLEVGGGTGDVEARARELVATAHGVPGAIRAELAELNETAIRDDLRDAIEQAMTVQEEEERSFAAITAGLLALRGDTAADRASPLGEVAPYKGLVAYGPEDGEWFCGRDELTAHLVARVSISRFIAVTGSSGSGKSSLVRAGLTLALRGDAIERSASWPIISVTPHGRPLMELAEQLVAHAGGDSASVLADRLRAHPTLLADIATRLMEDRADGDRLIIVVDQFEEVFTHCRSDDERFAFFDALVHAARVPGGPATILIVLRGDYYGHCSAHPELAHLVAANHLLIGPMSPSELRLAVEEPARRAGLAIDAELVDHAVDDASGEPGMLPLLSTAMLETWKRRHDGRLTLDAYLTTGGVRGAIARLAESVYERLSAEERSALRTMLLRLAELGEDGDDVRRRATLDELVTSPTRQEVLDALVSHRLVTVDAGRAEVAHEALLREWPRLRTWLEEDRTGRRLHRQLTTDARAWEEAGRTDDRLYRGVRLDSALDWTAGRADELHPSEHAFLEASQSAWQRELSASRTTARRFHWLVVALGVLLVAALAAVALAQVQRRSERRARALANQSAALTLALQSTDVQGENPALALALGAESAARTRPPLPAATKALFDAGVASGRGGLQPIDEPIVGHDGPVFGVAYSPNGAVMASSGQDGTVRLWDAHTRAPVGGPLVGHGCDEVTGCNVSAVVFSPDNQTVASAGDDGTVRLWDVATGQEKGAPLLHDAQVYGVAFSPDGTRLATGGANGSVRLWDVATGALLREFRGHDPAKEVWAVAFSPTGLLASASADRSVRLWDTASGEQVGDPLLGHTDGVQGLAFNADGSRLASSGSLADRTVRVWDPETGEQVGPPLVGHTLGIWGVAFDPSGALLASGSEDGTVRLWDVARGTEVGPPAEGHVKTVFGISFSPDGHTLASAGADATLRLWAVHDPKLRELGPHPGDVFGVGFSPDGSLVAAAGTKGTVQLWDAATGAPRGEPLVGHDPAENVSAAIFSPDGTTLTSASDDGTVRLWDVDTRQEAEPALPFEVGAYGLAYNADGSRLAAVGDGGKIVVWDTATWTPTGGAFAGHDGFVWSVAFSPDGTSLATGGGDGTVRLWDAATGEAIRDFRTEGGGVNVVRFSPDGDILASGNDAGSVELWDVRSGTRRRELTGHAEAVRSLAFDPSSGLLVSSSDDQTIRLWDTRTGAELSAIVDGHRGPVWSVALDPTTKILATAGADRTVRLWNWVVDAATACELAAPAVTAEQVEEYLQPTSAVPACALR